MKKLTLLLAGLIVGTSACMLASCAKPYTVTISVDGATQNFEVKNGEVPQQPIAPSKEGFVFRGWYLDEAGEQEYKFDKPLNADSTIYAVFDEKEYTITFVVEGTPTAVNFKWSETPSFPTPKKDGYVFKNWCSDEALNNTFEFTQPLRTEMTFYAKFVEAYKVQYVVAPNQDNVTTEIVETELETAPIRPADPVVEGYDFGGWFMDEAFTVPCEFDLVLAPQTPIYAKLTEKQYTVSYKVSGVEDPLFTETYNYWTVPTEPETPEYEGQYFFGYYLDEAFTNSYDFSYTFKEDTTIYLQFLESKPISTVEELVAIAEYPAGNYQLQNDITIKWETWAQIPEFSGKFDGNGYKIHKFMMTTTTANSGFFAVNKGTIKNLTLENFGFTSNHAATVNVGSLVGLNDGTIENCVVDNSAAGQGITYKNTYDGYSYTANYGGLVGNNSTTGVIKNCDVLVDIVYNEAWTASNYDYRSPASYSSSSFIGGAVAFNAGLINKVYSNIKLVSTHTVAGAGGKYGDEHDYGYLSTFTAGLVAKNTGSIVQCNAINDMNTTTSPSTRGYCYQYVGGFVCENSGTIDESVVTGAFVANGSGSECWAGGFVRNNAGYINDSYSDVTVTTNLAIGGYMGGFVAYNDKEINRCYALGTVNTKCTSYIGGFVGYDTTNAQIKTSFTAIDITATGGTIGAFIGGMASTNSSIANSYYASEMVITKNGAPYVSPDVVGVRSKAFAEIVSVENILEDMYWNDLKENVWNVDGEKAPTLLWNPIVFEKPVVEETPEV